MKKFATLAAAAIIAMTGATAYAQQGPGPGKGGDRQTNWQERRADMERLSEARIAGIPAGLKFTPEQVKLWQPLEETLKTTMQHRTAFMDKMREMRRGNERPDYLARLEAWTEMTQQEAKNSAKMLEQMKPFWASLDDNQKKLLPPLLQPGTRGAMHRGAGRMHDGPGPHRGGGHSQRGK